MELKTHFFLYLSDQSEPEKRKQVMAESSMACKKLKSDPSEMRRIDLLLKEREEEQNQSVPDVEERKSTTASVVQEITKMVSEWIIKHVI